MLSSVIFSLVFPIGVGLALIYALLGFADQSKEWLAKATFLFFSSQAVLSVLLQLLLHPRLLRSIPDMISKARGRLAAWLLIPPFVVLALWGWNLERLWMGGHFAFADSAETVGEITESTFHRSMGRRSHGRYWDTSYTYAVEGKTYSVDFQAADEHKPSSRVTILYAKRAAEISMIKGDPYFWYEVSRHFSMPMFILLAGNVFLSFGLFEWRKARRES